MTVKNLSATTIYPYQKLFWFSSYTLLVLVTLYLYFISTIIIGAVGRENLQTEFSSLQSAVNQLESDSVFLSGNVTIDLAHQLGYQDAANHSSFAYEAEVSGVALSYRQ